MKDDILSISQLAIFKLILFFLAVSLYFLDPISAVTPTTTSGRVTVRLVVPESPQNQAGFSTSASQVNLGKSVQSVGGFVRLNSSNKNVVATLRAERVIDIRQPMDLRVLTAELPYSINYAGYDIDLNSGEVELPGIRARAQEDVFLDIESKVSKILKSEDQINSKVFSNHEEVLVISVKSTH